MGNIYTANLTAGALLVPESRKIADLMIRQVSAEEWKAAIEQQNILQKLNVASSKRISVYIRTRLELMTSELWTMVRDGDSILATQASFAAAIKQSRILGDYLDLVVREQFKRLEERLTPALWDEFIVTCKHRDPLMEDFPPTTADKMRSAVHRVLVEAGYLRSVQDWHLKRIAVLPELIEYLERQGEKYVIKCIQADT